MSEPLQSEPIEIPRAPLWLRLVPAVCLVAGVGLGVALMVYYKRPPSLDSLRQGSTGPVIQRKPARPSLGTPPGAALPPSPSSSPLSDTTGLAAGATAGMPPGMADPAVPTVPGGETPPGTPSGTVAPPTLSGSLSGGLAGTGTDPVKPIVIDTNQASNVTAKFTEFVATVADLDVEPLLNQVRTLAKASGGQVQLSFERDPDRPEAGTDLFLAIPLDKAEKFRDDLAKIGLLQTDSWSGPYSERHFRMERLLRDAGGKIESRLSLLKVKYLDDAPEVVRNEALRDRIQKALKEFKSVPADREGIRVFVGKTASGWP